MNPQLSAVLKDGKIDLGRVFCVIALCCGILTAYAAAQKRADIRATASRRGDAYELANSSLQARVTMRGEHLGSVTVRDRASGRTIDLGDEFSFTQANRAVQTAYSLIPSAPPMIENLLANPAAARVAEQFAGKQICLDFAQDNSLSARWCMVLRDGSSYLRQTLTLRANGSPASLQQVTMLDLRDPDARIAGTVAGSPVVDSSAFFAFEHPLAKSTVAAGRILASLRRTLPLQHEQEITCSSVVGFARPGQLRRTFLAYLERERVHPYRPFLTYNSWYDLAYGGRYDVAGALDRVHDFGEELTRKRGVSVDSFLFDDGWDDPRTMWQFNRGFPEGMAPVSKAASSFGAGVGMWLSPWGGYDKAKLERIAFGRTHDYEIVNGGYALSGPRYFRAFEDVCLQLLDKYSVNQFKFDGTGNADEVFPGSLFDSDFDAAIHLLNRLRSEKPDLFINLTTGTYPSPFWLEYADSIWRGGEDHSFAGTGSWRQKWITYRDAQTYRNIVQAGPLFPLNSLMLHGIIYAKQARDLGDPVEKTTHADQDFANEVWTFFGSGTDLQELYITPSLLNTSNWDELAAAARWSRSNSGTLRDTHWIAGDPAQLAIYGWASWSPKKVILVLRNPSERPQSISIDAQTAFELLPSGPRQYLLTDPRPNPARPALHLLAGKKKSLLLDPFEVQVWEGFPAVKLAKENQRRSAQRQP